MSGPLEGVRVVELAALAPVSMAGMLLADMGARVVRVDSARTLRMLQFGDPNGDLLRRGRESIAVDLKDERGRGILLDLLDDSQILIEGFRPGVCERLGIGPEECLERNPSLVYGRLSGWGQDGPLATTPGHDISYLAMSGTLHHGAEEGSVPQPYLNYVGDFGGGSMLLLVGVLAALQAVRTNGTGQVVDASMLDGAALFSTHTRELRRTGMFDPESPQDNFLQGSAPFYRTYRCADGLHLSVGAAEAGFYEGFCRLFALDDWGEQWDRAAWPERIEELSTIIAQRTRDEWCERAEGFDACIAPVLTFDEAAEHPHLSARDTFVREGSGWLPAPAPRFSGTASEHVSPPTPVGAHSAEILRELGYPPEKVSTLQEAGVVAMAEVTDPTGSRTTPGHGTPG